MLDGGKHLDGHLLGAHATAPVGRDPQHAGVGSGRHATLQAPACEHERGAVIGRVSRLQAALADRVPEHRQALGL